MPNKKIINIFPADFTVREKINSKACICTGTCIVSPSIYEILITPVVSLNISESF
jgi:hypothetical protein